MRKLEIEGLTQQRRRVAAGERGGQRDKEGGHGSDNLPRRQIPLPDVVCWLAPCGWTLGLEMPADSEEQLKLSQCGTELHDREGSYLRLSSAAKINVEVQRTDRALHLLEEKGYVLFKLAGATREWGRRVRSLGSGAYLVVIPKDWALTQHQGSGGEEPVSLEGFKAQRFFVADWDSEPVSFVTATGEVVLPSSAPRFRLEGNLLDDVTVGVGPLFGSEAPSFKSQREEGCPEVSFYVVGEEGKEGKWRQAFEASKPLAEVLQGSSGGWYFLRFYNRDGDLLESHQFRFVRALSRIEIACRPIPDNDGHKPAIVAFSHESNCEISPQQQGSGISQIAGERHRTVTKYGIAARPNLDIVDWIVKSDRLSLNVRTRIDRIWWKLVGSNERLPVSWTSKSVEVERSAFRATSSMTLVIRLPCPRWVSEVNVLCGDASGRRYECRASASDLAIPLREFGDCIPEGANDQFLVSARFGVADPVVLVAARAVARPRPGDLTCCDCGVDLVTRGHSGTLGTPWCQAYRLLSECRFKRENGRRQHRMNWPVTR